MPTAKYSTIQIKVILFTLQHRQFLYIFNYPYKKDYHIIHIMVMRTNKAVKWTAAGTTGLFLSRILGELWSQITNTPLHWITIAIFSLLITGLAWSIFRKYDPRLFWPALFSWGYILFPEVDFAAAGYVSAILITAVLLNHRLLYPQMRRFVPAKYLNVGLSAVFLALYVVTLAPDVLPADNGEFQWIAAQLGVAHPPGFTLYTMLSYLAARIPIGSSAAYRVNLFSAFVGAATLFLIFKAVYDLTKSKVAAITAVLTLGTATTYWAQSTIANIRSLTGFFTALFLFSLIRFAHEKKESDNWLAWGALALGFGMTHHPSLVFIGIVGIIFIFGVQPSLIRTPRRWIQPFLFGIFGLLPLIYLPLRANSGAPGASPALATLDGFLNHVLARGFSGDFFYFIEPGVLWERFKVMGNVMTFQFNGWLLLGMGLGLFIAIRHNKKLAWLLGGGFLLHTFITATYRAPQTVEYMLPAYIPAVLLLGSGVGHFINTFSGNRPEDTKHHIVYFVGTSLTAVFIITALFQGINHYSSFAALHQNKDTRRYAETLLNAAPNNTIILADWHWYTPLRYLQEVESQRSDVVIKFVPPGEGRYEITWANRIQAELDNGRSVIATHFEETAYTSLPVPEPVGEAFLFRQQPLQTLPDDYIQTDIRLANTHILGYQLSSEKTSIWQEAVVTVAWTTETETAVSLYAHLIGFDGRLYAQDDLFGRVQPDGITFTQFRLTPRLGAAPGDFAVWLGSGEERAQLATITVKSMQTPPVTQQAVYRTLVGERPFRRLIGYDWDNTLPGCSRLYLHWQTATGYQTETIDEPVLSQLPPLDTIGPWGIKRTFRQNIAEVADQHYVPFSQGIIWVGGGLDADERVELETAVTLRPTFLSSRPILRDLAISVRLIGYQTNSDLWAWWFLNDSIPAMGAIPTLKWIQHSQIQSPHFLKVDESAVSGQQIGTTLRLYDAFTNRPLAILDERIVAQNPWIPLGNGQIR